MSDITKSKELIHDLYNKLSKRSDPSNELLDILDVLYQVYLKIDTVNNPEAYVQRLVNYIYSVGLKGRLYFPEDENRLIAELGIIGQKAGLNGLYKANYGDKSQFYSYFDENKMPRS
ncbi:bacteriocin immunity protein [Listeria aquatica]|uniref:EntI protein n=1 Tax=Listeria aquatica FSL S10-1188 TaxID=1265818 RepID=W7B3G7_9LIST|nr:bacteriocin immunity protein [Listeria aquatica]EUJ21804.1 entI protein [Listeria aquatica FSL S10-1188]